MNQPSGLPRDSFDLTHAEQLVLDMLRQERRFTFEELVERVPELSWAQLFVTIDLLSRRGDIELRREGFTYTARTTNPRVNGMEGINGAAHHDHR